jgi:hypothetical protein
MVDPVSDTNMIRVNDRDVLRRLARLKDEVGALRSRIELMRPADASERVHPERHRTDHRYSPEDRDS